MITHTQETLFNIATDTSLSLDERANKLINIGLEEFDMELGIISEIKDQAYTVIYSNNEDLVGQEFKLGATYCSITLNMVASKVFSVEHFSKSQHNRHPAYEAFKLESYIGSPIMVKPRVYGTVNFTNSSKRDEKFSQEDELLIKNLSLAISKIISERLAEIKSS